MTKKWTPEGVERMLANPFYAITVHPLFTEEHPYLISEELWIAAAAKMIGERGAESFLELLLDVLKGNIVTEAE